MSKNQNKNESKKRALKSTENLSYPEYGDREQKVNKNNQMMHREW